MVGWRVSLSSGGGRHRSAPRSLSFLSSAVELLVGRDTAAVCGGCVSAVSSPPLAVTSRPSSLPLLVSSSLSRLLTECLSRPSTFERLFSRSLSSLRYRLLALCEPFELSFSLSLSLYRSVSLLSRVCCPSVGGWLAMCGCLVVEFERCGCCSSVD